MSTSEIHERINALLQLIEINNNRLFLNEKEIPRIELHQLRNYIVELYTAVDKLELSANDTNKEKPNASPSDIKVETKSEADPMEEPATVVSEPQLEEPPLEQIPTPLPTPTPEEIKTPEPEAVEPKPEPTEVQTRETQPPQKVEPVKQEKKNIEVPSPSTTRGDLYEKFKHSKLESIKKGISISKRYEMQNELFQNQPDSFNNAIQSLDKAASLEDAIYLIDHTYAEEFDWDLESPLVDELKILCLRRHM